MKKFKGFLLSAIALSLFACTTEQPSVPPQVGYLKREISQHELNDSTRFKRYHYACKNDETGSTSYLAAYFPLWKESRLQENFGFYFQLDNGKVEPFDHLENRSLNRAGTRFEVSYRSYYPIQGEHIDLKAREHSSVYYKSGQKWLECRES